MKVIIECSECKQKNKVDERKVDARCAICGNNLFPPGYTPPKHPTKSEQILELLKDIRLSLPGSSIGIKVNAFKSDNHEKLARSINSFLATNNLHLIDIKYSSTLLTHRDWENKIQYEIEYSALVIFREF